MNSDVISDDDLLRPSVVRYFSGFLTGRQLLVFLKRSVVPRSFTLGLFYLSFQAFSLRHACSYFSDTNGRRVLNE
ncbi:hypothetical protein [Marinomonas sp.]|uniref:hypothetical protein n=1 Tax=Marinomonas sp. TaxID=1904862 RepID=UPI003BA8457A